MLLSKLLRREAGSYVVLCCIVSLLLIEGTNARANEVEYCPAISPNYKTGIENLHLFYFLERHDSQEKLLSITEEIDELLFNFNGREKQFTYDCISKFLGPISLSLCTPIAVRLKFNIELSLAPELRIDDPNAYCFHVANNFANSPNDIFLSHTVEIERLTHRLNRCGLQMEISPRSMKYFIEDLLFEIRWPNYSDLALSNLLKRVDLIIRTSENCEFIEKLFSQYGQEKGLELALYKIK